MVVVVVEVAVLLTPDCTTTVGSESIIVLPVELEAPEAPAADAADDDGGDDDGEPDDGLSLRLWPSL